MSSEDERYEAHSCPRAPLGNFPPPTSPELSAYSPGRGPARGLFPGAVFHCAFVSPCLAVLADPCVFPWIVQGLADAAGLCGAARAGRAEHVLFGRPVERRREPEGRYEGAPHPTCTLCRHTVGPAARAGATRLRARARALSALCLSRDRPALITRRSLVRQRSLSNISLDDMDNANTSWVGGKGTWCMYLLGSCAPPLCPRAPTRRHPRYLGPTDGSVSAAALLSLQVL